MKLITKST